MSEPQANVLTDEQRKRLGLPVGRVTQQSTSTTASAAVPVKTVKQSQVQAQDTSGAQGRKTKNTSQMGRRS